VNDDLKRVIVERIQEGGPLPFAAFMSLALYDRRHGYYARPDRTGFAGHFLTSPELDPAFGELWAEGLVQIWTACDRPTRFEVIEVGPGEGTFAAAVLATAPRELTAALVYRLVERMPALEDRQRSLLEGRGNIDWIPSLQEVPGPTTGCVIANEVLDNLPVHLVERRDGRLHEVCVALSDGELTTALLPLSNPELARFLERCRIDLPEGHRFEVGLAAEGLIAHAVRTIGRGAIVFVDYGLDADELAARPNGTLLAYSAGGADDDILAAPGRKDITAHANWTAVGVALHAHGLEVVGPMSQRTVLKGLGLDALDSRLADEHRAAADAGHGADALRALSRRQALGALADPGGLGGLGVVVGLKGIEAPAFLRP
jgi:SAM-dependent MidA family methyltransferase